VEYVTKGLASGALKPVIDRTFTFDEMADVHRYLEQNGQFGKLIVWSCVFLDDGSLGDDRWCAIFST
jgi:hypothetical protein